MKHILAFITILSVLLFMTSCGSQPASGSRKESLSPTVNDVLDERTAESETINGSDDEENEKKEAAEDNNTSEPEVTSGYKNVDIDLTLMNATMVYSQVYDMVTEPDGYIGKTVRMNGQFAVYDGEERVYCACVVADATACCQQGIEFILRGEPSYPEGYPELGSEVTVAGVFDTYIETVAGQDFTFIQLIDADLE